MSSWRAAFFLFGADVADKPAPQGVQYVVVNPVYLQPWGIAWRYPWSQAAAYAFPAGPSPKLWSGPMGAAFGAGSDPAEDLVISRDTLSTVSTIYSEFAQDSDPRVKAAKLEQQIATWKSWQKKYPLTANVLAGKIRAAEAQLAVYRQQIADLKAAEATKATATGVGLALGGTGVLVGGALIIFLLAATSRIRRS